MVKYFQLRLDLLNSSKFSWLVSRNIHLIENFRLAYLLNCYEWYLILSDICLFVCLFCALFVLGWFRFQGANYSFHKEKARPAEPVAPVVGDKQWNCVFTSDM